MLTDPFKRFLSEINCSFPGLLIYASTETEAMGLDAQGAPCGVRVFIRFEDEVSTFTCLSEGHAMGVIKALTIAGMDRSLAVAKRIAADKDK